MKTKTLLAILVLIAQTNVWAQNLNLQWVKQIGGGNATSGQMVTISSSNYLYVVGTFNGTIDLDPSGGGLVNITEFSSTSYDYFVAKYDLNGNYQNYYFTFYSLSESTTIHSIAVDQFGNVYLGGESEGGLHIDSQSWGVFVQNISYGFLARFDTNGDLSWLKQYVSAADNSVRSIALDSNDDLIASGYFGSTVNFGSNPVAANGTDGFVVKYDGATNDEFAWFAQLTDNGNAEDVLKMKMDASNNIYLVGNFNTNTDFDFGVTSSNPINGSNPGTTYFAKYNSSLALQWVKNLDLTDASSISDIEIDGSGNIYLAGEHKFEDDLDPSANYSNLTPISPNNFTDGFFAKYNSSGNYQFGKLIGTTQQSGQGELVYEIEPTSCQEIIVYGTATNSEVFLDPNNPTTITYTHPGGNSKYFATYDVSGNYVGHDKIEFSMDNWFWHNGSIYLSQGFSGSVDFDPGSNSTTLTSSNGDLFYAKYDVTTCPLTPPVSIDESESQSNRIYPNPNNGIFTLNINNADLVGSNFLQVYDTKGQLVFEKYINANGSVNEQINLNIADGVYFVKINTAEKTATSKIVIKK